MTTTSSHISELNSVATALTGIINKYSLAYQVSDVQVSSTPNPIAFGIKKKSDNTGFEIVQKPLTSASYYTSESFTEEMVDDIFALYGENAKTIINQIAGNEIVDDLDTAVLNYMNSIAKVYTTLSLDLDALTNHDDITNNIIVKINEIRLAMATVLKRGLPNILIVTPGVASILISYKLLKPTEKVTEPSASRENINYLGFVGDMEAFIDFNSVYEYIMLAHKSPYIKGDASIILVPVGEPIVSPTMNKESGIKKILFKQRFAYTRNPLDKSETGDSLFIGKLGVTITGSNDWNLLTPIILSDLIFAAPILGTPDAGMLLAVTSVGITTAAPTLGTPTAGTSFAMTAANITSGTPELGTPTANQD